MNFIRTSSLGCILPTFRLKSTQVKDYDYNGWIFNYFERDEKYSTVKAQFEPTFNVSPLDYHKKTTFQLLSFLSDKKINLKYFKLLDLELSERIGEKTSEDELLAVVNSFAISNRPSTAIKKVLPFLRHKVLNENFTVSKVIQSLYYLSAFGSKDHNRQLVTLASKRVTQNISALNKKDMAIFCLSLFSSGVPIKDAEVLRKISDIIQDELNSNSDSLFPKLLVCYIKLLRLSQFYDDDLFSVLSDRFQKKNHEIPFTSMVHIAVYFCDAFYSDIAFIESLLAQLVEEADRKISRNEDIRLKDIDNLLYSASNYCVPEINKIFQNSHLTKILKKKFDTPLVPQNKIIDILAWFWILECRIDDVVKKFITPENISTITGSRFFKDFAKLNLLLSCVKIEAPGLLDFDVKPFQNNRLEPRLGPYLGKRPDLKKAFEFLERNKGSFGLSHVQISFQVPGLYIAGIKAFNSNDLIHIEVLDEMMSLRNSTLPKGQMSLKIRLLKKMGQKVLLIKTNALNQQNEEWEHFLKESLKAQLSAVTTSSSNGL